MDQNVIAGIGNIYSDDILWLSQIHPLRAANSLSQAELSCVYKSMRSVLKKALKLRGTSISDFRDTAGEPGFYSALRLVYQRKGEPCGRCGSIIKKVKIGARSGSFCPTCQK
ncbi:MAG: hypothetical protein HYR95_00275 [Candidatus Colwellbacteria bacterium]|nr:hypothetical protein [Candidatus Colwellbacteria bacterium]